MTTNPASSALHVPVANQGLVAIKRALISVSDKTGLLEFGKLLAKHDVEILSTGGSAKTLEQAGIPVIEVADYTKFPEIMDGRVKTLHPRIHGGILGRRDVETDRDAMRQHDIGPIDMVVVNLYPFVQTVARGHDFATCIENIDIGGPAMIRAAAKNHESVSVVTSQIDYEEVMAELVRHNGAISLDMRRRLAAKAFSCTANYESAVSRWFAQQLGDTFPERISVAGKRKQVLRYGENPHQKAAFYLDGSARPGVGTAQQVQGKELSFNNLNDTDAAFELVAEFEEPAVAIIKHANPCGVAVGGSLADAWSRALTCDPVSAYGGIIALNRTLDRESAQAMSAIFSEVIIAPDADVEARKILEQKKNLRLLLTGAMPDPNVAGVDIRSLAGGLLVQSRDNLSGLASSDGSSEYQVVSKRKPTDSEMADMVFAFTVCKHVKSNAIVYVKERSTVGVGAGQMSRVDSAHIAAQKAADAARAAGESGSRTVGSAVASDAFFPFADGLIAAAEAGATAVIQPGGSVRDEEVIAAADARDLAMVFTGRRHFRH